MLEQCFHPPRAGELAFRWRDGSPPPNPPLRSDDDLPELELWMDEILPEAAGTVDTAPVV